MKNNIGKLAYYLKGIEELPKMKPFNLEVLSQDMTFSGEALFLLIMNGRSAGGFRTLVPSASVKDGLLEVIILKPCSLVDFMPLLMQASMGEHIDNPNIVYFQTNLTDDSFKFSDVKKVIEQLPAINFTIPKFKTGRNIVDDVGELIKGLPKHNAFNYVNKGSLSDDYFRDAGKTLDNGYLYVVLSSTGSAAGETIRRVTKKEYSHASLSFDEELKTIVSYNGGENIYSPGLNAEMIEFFYQKDDANIIIYKIKASREQKETVLTELKKINEQGSSYNVLGLFVPYSHKKNIMSCSQFVFCMLKAGGIAYFEKQPEKVKPTDFVELDYERKLEYCGRLFAKDILSDT